MFGMTTVRKLKVSLTLSADLVALIDRDANNRNDTRSGIVEEWLRRAASATAETAIEDATAAYYLGLRGAARSEADHLSHGLSKAARRVSYDNEARSAHSK